MKPDATERIRTLIVKESLAAQELSYKEGYNKALEEVFEDIIRHVHYNAYSAGANDSEDYDYDIEEQEAEIWNKENGNIKQHLKALKK